MNNIGDAAMRKIALALAAASAVAIAAPANAATLVSENFESSLGAFTATGQAGINTGTGYIGCCGTTGSVANMANHFVAFGSGDLPSGLISSPITLVGGTSYTLSFDYATLGAGSDTLFALIDGHTFSASQGANNNMDTTFHAYSFTWTATGGPSALQFNSGGTISADAILDNVLLTGLAAAVPEPSTWAMMLLGFGAIGFAMRRRRVMQTA
jgi:hypothetical protein